MKKINWDFIDEDFDEKTNLLEFIDKYVRIKNNKNKFVKFNKKYINNYIKKL